ncbi:MAG TPA: MFS transporter [Chloroflexota bacterium]
MLKVWPATAARPLGWPTGLAAMAHRDYRLLWAGSAVSHTGHWMQQVAIGWLVFDMTGSGAYLGLAGFLRSIPQLFLSVPGGIMADRTDRRRLLGACQGTTAALTLVLALLVQSGRAGIWSVLTLTFLLGCTMALTFPVRQTLVPNTVPREDLASAVGLNSAGNNLTRTLGPAIAGALLSTVGVAICFFLQAAGLIFAFWTSLAMRISPRERALAPASPRQDLVEGWRYVRATPAVWGLLLSAAVPTALGMPYMALLPMFARDYGIGAGGLGALMTVLGCGSIAGSVGFAAAGDFARKGPIMLLSAGVFGLTLLALAGSGSLPLALVSLFAAGCASSVYQATNNTLLQTIVPDALRGRVISAYNLTWGLMPLGTLPLGWLADQAGAPLAVGVAGGLCLVFSVAAALRLPQLRAL